MRKASFANSVPNNLRFLPKELNYMMSEEKDFKEI